MIETKRKDGESPNALLYRFTKKVRQSGVLLELRKRRFHKRGLNRVKRRNAAIYRTEKKEETKRLKKLGQL